MTTKGPLPLVKVIGTGGTIGMVGRDRLDLTEYELTGKFFTIEELLAKIPEAARFATVETEQFRSIGSNKITTKDWLELSQLINNILEVNPKVAGVVVTHGTATLEETAYFLNLTVKSNKPVVLVGAQRPTTAIGSDAEINLLDAIKVAACPDAKGKGVLVVMNQEINAAREVTKTWAYRLETFTGRDMGFLGYADADGRVVFYREPLKKHTHNTEFDVRGLKNLPRVELVYAYTGADGFVINALVERGVDGIVAAAFGSGSLTAGQEEALLTAAGNGVAVVVCSKVGSGRVVPSAKLRRNNIVTGDNLLPQKARILLTMALTRTKHVDELQRIFLEY